MQRTGRINSPSYRIVVTEHTAGPKAGKFVEKLGTYNPKSKQRTLNEERVKYWMSVGAKPSDTMHNMLISLGLVQGKKINVLPAYQAPEAPAEEAAPASPAAPQGEPAAEAPVAEAAAPEAPAEEPVAEDVSSEASAKEEKPAESEAQA